MDLKTYYSKSNSKVQEKLSTQKSLFIKTTVPEIAPEDKTLENFNKEDLISKNLKVAAQKFLEKLKTFDKEEPLYFLVNKKKVILQKVYYNLINELKNYRKIKVLYVHKLKGGTFTNPQNPNYIDAKNVFVFLTRNYNKKEINILKELEKVRISNINITLNLTFVNDTGYTININSIKTLYLFLYALSCEREKTSYKQFVKKYEFTDKELDFDSI